MSNLIPTVGIVPYYNNSLVLVKRIKEPFLGKYSIITGHLNSNESPGAGAVRELYEEFYSKYNLPISKIISLYIRHNFKSIGSVDWDYQNKKYKVSIFRCEIYEDNFNISEVEDIKFLDEIDPSELGEATKQLLSFLNELPK